MTPTFAELGVPSNFAKPLRELGLTHAFPIQAATLSDALAGRDICGKAPTGSGKTLAFSIPIAALVGEATPGRPRALILTPTRELAAQVSDALVPLTSAVGRRTATFYGGKDIRRDLESLKRGVDVVVATPGRLEDLVQRRACDLRDVDLVVIDEADRMADMGFLPAVKRLLDETSEDRQTLLFSATLDGDVDVLVRRYQHDPVRVEVEQPAVEDGDVRHLFWPTERLDRKTVTIEIVNRVSPAIVFTRTKRGADRLARQLNQAGVRTAAIHGDRSQGQRERALREFQAGKVAALVATDVAARGIHVDHVGTVVHFDVPGSDKDYVHRSGRTGRAGASGVVVTLVTPEDDNAIDDIQRTLQMPRGIHLMDFDDLTSSAPSQLRPHHSTTRPRGSGPGKRPRGSRGGGKPRQRSNNANGAGNERNRNGSSTPSRKRSRNSSARQAANGSSRRARAGKRPQARSSGTGARGRRGR